MKNLKNNKGFTLIEIVIVIVIIAILAAMLVPSLLQWVDNANQKAFLEAANTIKSSTLSQMTECYATKSEFSWEKVSDLVGKDVNFGEEDYTVSEPDIETGDVPEGNTADTFVVTDGTYTATWNGTSWAVSKS